MKFYQRAEIKDVLAYFRLINNMKDDRRALYDDHVPKATCSPITTANWINLVKFDYFPSKTELQNNKP